MAGATAMTEALRELLSLAEARRVIERRLEQLVEVCWVEGVKRSLLAEALGVSRAGLYRRFGGGPE